MKNLRLTDIFFIILILTLFTGCKGSNESMNQEAIQLGSNREIFVDYYLIDKLEGTNIILHNLTDKGVVMYFDKPWEGQFCTYTTILKDENLFRLYYRGLPDISGTEITCYAESKDGINWEKPSLLLCEIMGSKENNVLLDSKPITHNFSPFIDTNPESNPEQKYKALGGSTKSGLIPYTSPDGVLWMKLQDESVIKMGKFDSQNVSFWSESEKQYVCYFRIFTEKKFRSVSRTTSKNFINWTEPVEMTYGDTPLEQMYTQQTSPYFRAPHIYLAIGARLMPDRQTLTEEQLITLKVDSSQYKGLSEPYFMSTRGGNLYDRTFMESFIRPGIGFNNWTARTNYPALNVVQTGPEEMSVYVNQDYAQPTAHLHRYSLRLDGFTSIKAPYSGGVVITKPFTFTGKELEINYSTSVAGEIRIELQDKNGKPLPGYTLEEAQPLIGNEISRVVTWNENGDIEKLASNPIRLHIYMKDADLYSIRFK
jgi:hypothetical protein